MVTYNVYRNGKYIGFADEQGVVYKDEADNRILGTLDNKKKFTASNNEAADLDGLQCAVHVYPIMRSVGQSGRMEVTVK